jgi:hypothetical protein
MISKGRGCFRIRLIGASASELEKTHDARVPKILDSKICLRASSVLI